MSRSSWKSLFVVPLLATVPVAVACGGGETGGGMESGEGAGQPTMESGAQSEVVDWTALNESGVTGDVEFVREGGTLEVATLANSLGGPGDYGTEILTGTCASLGETVVTLNPSTAHEPGIGEGETEVDASQLQAGQSYVVIVRALQGEPVACAPVPAELLEADA
ncbi:MAG: hypothetical protein R3223_07140 [Longimicrobiales bacterium]|nr:hypothetical protein [Longimicrobiales bacterium]